MKFKAKPVNDLTDVTLDLEQLETRDILDKTQATILSAPSGTMVTRTRVMGTAYQPNTTRPTFVTTTISLNVTASNAICEVRMDAANPPVTVVARPVVVNAGAAQVQVLVPVSFIVPSGFFYELVSTGATAATVDRTFEYAL